MVFELGHANVIDPGGTFVLDHPLIRALQVVAFAHGFHQSAFLFQLRFRPQTGRHVKVCILEDQYQFVLHHQVMQQQTDEQVAVSMLRQAKKRHPDLTVCSFDKGFHSTENQSALGKELEFAVLPRKGKLSQQAQALELSPAFIKARHKHSAVESAINALEVHGLDMCPDHGIGGFKRYVALAVIARNIHRIGAILWQQEQERAKRKRKYSDRDTTHKLAA